MRVSNVALLRRYYNSTTGAHLREKVLNKVWPNRNEKLQPCPAQAVWQSKGILESDKFSISRRFFEIAENSPNQVFFVSNGVKYTAGEVSSNVKRLANGLKKIGVKAGDRVALMVLPHERELFESFFAIQAIGAVPVLINFRSPPETIAYMFARTNAKTLIVGRDFRFRAGANKLALGGLLERIVTIGQTDYSEASKPTDDLEPEELKKLRTQVRLSVYNPLAHTYKSLINNNEELPSEELILNPDKNAEALQLFTSGTSGTPKRMTYTYEMVAHTAKITSGRFPITKDDTWLFGVPFYHLAGLLNFCGPLTHYESNEANLNKPLMVLTEVPRTSKPSTIQKALKNIIENKVAIFPGVPKIIEPVLEEALKKGLLLESLRIIFSGAAPMTPNLVNLVEKLNKKRAEHGIDPIKIINFYASTECGAIACTVKPITLDTLDFLGLPFDGVEVKISDDGNKELLIRVPHFPPELSPDLLTPDGFFKTGDQVEIKDDGTLNYLDRLTDCLNVNGEKISPLVIQREIEKMPEIKEAHVFGVTKPQEKTDIVCAVVVPEDDVSIEQKDVKRFLLRNLSSALRAFIPRVIFIEPNGIPDKLIGSTGKTPRKLFQKAYGERAIDEYRKTLPKPPSTVNVLPLPSEVIESPESFTPMG